MSGQRGIILLNVSTIKGISHANPKLRRGKSCHINQCKSERRCLAAVTSPRRTGWENNERIKSTRMETSHKTKELWHKKRY